jgi:uncharacterized protein YbjT (DUF2867 family)
MSSRRSRDHYHVLGDRTASGSSRDRRAPESGPLSAGSFEVNQRVRRVLERAPPRQTLPFPSARAPPMTKADSARYVSGSRHRPGLGMFRELARVGGALDPPGSRNHDSLMRVAVVGGSGLAGRHTVEALLRAGHEAVVVARSTGVNVLTGDGLDAALAAVDVVIDTISLQATDAEATRSQFETAMKNLLSAEQRAGVRHHVLLSIVGIDRVKGNAHYEGKRIQEALLAASQVPATIQRVSQFHDFAGTLVSWLRKDGVVQLPPLLLQPVAISDVAEILVEVATGSPRGRAVDFAGPEPQDLIDMARRTLEARGESLQLVPSWRHGPFGLEAAGEVFLPGPEARLGRTTFDRWLNEQRERSAARPRP